MFDFRSLVQNYTGQVFPQPLVTQLAQVFPDAVFYKRTSDRIIALTIDDVGDRFTEPILEALAQHPQAKATFFVITDYIKDNPQIITYILQQGHEIGNHGVLDRTHAHLLPKDFAKEFEQAHRDLIQQTDTIVKWFRPGRGLYNPSMLKIIRDKPGYHHQLALASMLPLDTYTLSNEPQLTIRYVSQFLFPGSILILHGGAAKDGTQQRSLNTARVLREILPMLEDRGFRVVTLSELFELTKRH